MAAYADVALVNVFAGGVLDRQNNSRRHGNHWLEGLERDRGKFRLLPFIDLKPLVSANSKLQWLSIDEFEKLPQPHERLYLGEWRALSTNCFAANWSTEDVAQAHDARFLGVRDLLKDPAADAADECVVAHAMSLFQFHQKHRFCGQCGKATVLEEGGGRRACTDTEKCKGLVFPRSDPVAICLVVDPRTGNCMLGRQARWPAGQYSCLAGFRTHNHSMEHGESVEDAARREVLEESGIILGRVRYHSSQPWPLPYSLMMGCIGEALTTDVHVDPHELEDARWFTREEIGEMLANFNNLSEGTMRTPPPATIAHQLAKAYFEQHPITVFAPST